MNDKKTKRLIREYSEIPCSHADVHLKKWTEKRSTLPEKERKVSFGAFTKTPYFIGGLVCLVVLALVLPAVLLTEKTEDAPALYYCDEDDPILYADIDSIESYNEKYHTEIKPLTDTAVLRSAQEVFFGDYDTPIGLKGELNILLNYIGDADFCAYINIYRLPREYYPLKESTVVYGLTVLYEVELDPSNGDYTYYLCFTYKGVSYYVKLLCFQETTIENIMTHIFR